MYLCFSLCPFRLLQCYVFYRQYFFTNKTTDQIEKGKQDDALSDLSSLLGELKGMAVDMGSEIERSVNGVIFECYALFCLPVILVDY